MNTDNDIELQKQLAATEIQKLQLSQTNDEITQSLERLFDIQQGELHQTATDTLNYIYQTDQFDSKLPHLNYLHRLTGRALKLQPGPIGNASITVLPTMEEAQEIQTLGGPKGLLKKRYLDFAQAAYQANPKYFLRRLEHNFSPRKNTPSPLTPQNRG